MSPAQPERLRGIGVSAGTAVGPVVQVAPSVPAPDTEPAPADPEAAAAQVRAAYDQVADDLVRRASHASEAAQHILQATALMAKDKSLRKATDALLTAGKGPATAVQLAVENYAEKLEAAGGYFADRVTDLRDVGSRTIAAVLGVPAPGVPALKQPSIVVARDLAPADTALLDRDLVVGIVTEHGGRTSHTAILAAQMGIPAIVGCAGATDVPQGTPVAIDGSTGEVVLRPSAEQLDDLVAAQERRAAALSSSSGPGVTSDGHPVALLANIGNVEQAELAAAADVEGIGLLRTEFLFIGSRQAPGLEEQTDAYSAIFRPFGTNRRIVVRTLDAGADKPLPFADLGAEENPALGRRGIRLYQQQPELLTTQLAAIAEAADATGADVRVMAPMVATAAEAQWFADQVTAAGLPTSGVMIEVPSAALRADQVLAPVDFASIGTNDLAQYAMAADRLHSGLATLLDPWQPAVLDLIQAACAGAASLSKPIGVCGESAGDPLLALVFVGLGVSSLSMTPSRAAAVRLALAAHSLAQCQDLAAQALQATSAADAAEIVKAAAQPAVRDLL